MHLQSLWTMISELTPVKMYRNVGPKLPKTRCYCTINLSDTPVILEETYWICLNTLLNDVGRCWGGFDWSSISTSKNVERTC